MTLEEQSKRATLSDAPRVQEDAAHTHNRLDLRAAVGVVHEGLAKAFRQGYQAQIDAQAQREARQASMVE